MKKEILGSLLIISLFLCIGCISNTSDNNKTSEIRIEISNGASNDFNCTVQLIDDNQKVILDKEFFFTESDFYQDVYIDVKYGSYKIKIYVNQTRLFEMDIEADYDGRINWDFVVTDNEVYVKEGGP